MINVKYYLSDNNEFVIENYNSSPTFSSFFPGIAGLFGVPMWVFYTNHGQCITSFGMQDKDGSIMEFQPANKAYKGVSINGFRTFIKVNGKYYEPFSEISLNNNKMLITPYDLTIIEDNKELKLSIKVNYFTLPNEPFPALVRKVTIKNHSAKKIKLEVIDGMPALVPNGFVNHLLKNMSQTIEAWAMVENMDNNAPFFRLKVVPSDAPETKLNNRGNFYASIATNGGKSIETRVLVNPSTVFGNFSSLELPGKFISTKQFVPPSKEVTDGFIPSAFSYVDHTLAAKQEIEITSVIGNIDSVDILNSFKNKLLNKCFIEQKYIENKRQIVEITDQIATESSSKAFDLYCRQSFLDNVMRGGLPICFGGKPFYVYYRKHGDMERDYNDFKLLPTYYSQGSGNYRDINQNRRNDIFFMPCVMESNIIRFFNLVQMDGFNPLIVLGSKYVVNSREAAEKLVKKHLGSAHKRVVDIICKPFVFGSLLKELDETSCLYATSKEALAAELITVVEKIEDAQHGEGFWTDHFSYNTDLLERFENIFPDRIKDILYNQPVFTYFDNEAVLQERNNKYFRKNDKIRQYWAVRNDPEKRSMISQRTTDKNIVRTEMGKGAIYRTTLISKMLCLIANKAASFDAQGIGIEMEADKPDWYDALNGLPGLLGSSLSETLELKRLAKFALDHLQNDLTVKLPVEVKDFMDTISAEIKAYTSDSDAFKLWDKLTTAKESYRARIRPGISGSEIEVNNGYISSFLTDVIGKCDDAVSKCIKNYGTYVTYFTNEVTEFEPLGGTNIKAKKIIQKPLPLFLEGFVHALKVEKDKKIPSLVRNSGLYDKKLKMYKVNASLSEASIELGRTKVFLPGWLENESIWLHMEYKYMLELLKAGLYKEFFLDFKNVVVPFLDPKIYKRSILENSSFISSSAYPDPSYHGRGFVARLSGATAEFLDMWIRMTCGDNIFFVDKNGKLGFKLDPVLPAWLFRGSKFSFKLLGSINVTYINSKKKDTFEGGVKPASYKLTLDDGKVVEIKGPSLSEEYALMVRERRIKNIIVSLG